MLALLKLVRRFLYIYYISVHWLLQWFASKDDKGEMMVVAEGSSNSTIQGGGYMILLQEQDAYGELFL